MAQRFYPAILDRADTGVGVVFPDLPGCTSWGATVQDAARNAVEALALHIEGMVADGNPIPEPSSPGTVPDWLDEADRQRIVGQVLVPVDMPGRAVRLNVTMDEGLVQRLDAAAAAEGFTRSGYLAQAVRERIQRSRDAA